MVRFYPRQLKCWYPLVGKFESIDNYGRHYKDFKTIRELFEFLSENLKEVDNGFDITYNKNGRMPVKNGLIVGWVEEISWVKKACEFLN